jgi:2-polyprenyl-3-methyl-5-hydroxy-6-metoxy-1,4-benzoquinol methylase
MVDNERFLSSFGALPDEQWLAALLRSTEERIVDGVMFPSFPDAALQFRFVGASGEEALRKAFVFYTEIKRYATMLRIPIDRNTRVLDFGCGWGRFYRFFLKDVAVANLLGVDVDQECIDLCRSTIPMGRFEKCDVRPSLASAAKASFDLIYAYSVLSHLSEETALAWTKEFARVLRPCGMLIVTTLKQAHIDVWDRKMQSGGVHWQAALETAGFSGPKFRSDFEAGKFLYCGIGGGGVRTADYYGEAIIPPGYVLRSWAPEFQLHDYVSHDKRGSQAVIVAVRVA